jgi:hypothetical protein
MTAPQPEEAHRWLHQLVGDWTFESADAGGHAGTERVRKLGELWVVGESEMRLPEGGTASAIITIGYDLDRKRFVGSWVGTMMAKLWVYDGELDFGGRMLSLYSEGPSFDEQGNFSKTSTSRYRDAIELNPDGTRTFTGSVQQPDRSWSTFMTVRYRRSG